MHSEKKDEPFYSIEMNNNNFKRKKICGVILAAGYGTRMKPLSTFIPKPLLPVLGKPLINILIKKLLRAGSSSVHVNIHHLAELFNRNIVDPEWPVTYHIEDQILDTGGGIGNMANSLNAYELILIHNGDIISNIDFTPAIDFHLRHKSLATMILTETKETDQEFAPGQREDNHGKPARTTPPSAVDISEKMEILNIGTKKTDDPAALKRTGYTGMSILSREALKFFPGDKKIGFIEILLEMIRNKAGKISGYMADDATDRILWSDIGSPETYLDLHKRILLKQAFFDPEIAPSGIPLHVGPDTVIASGTSWKGFLEVGGRAKIEHDCELENCVVLPETTVQKGTRLKNCILFPEGQINVKGL